jgi:glycosyltransferase involved in cell wall biosynthesis
LAGAFACKLQTRNRPRVVFTFRGLSVLAPGYKTNALKKRFYEWSYKAFLPFVDVGVFQCETNRDTANDLGINTKHEAVIMDGINAEEIDFMPYKEARQKLEGLVRVELAGKKVVGTIGRLSYQKNYSFLIQQMRKLKKYRQDVVCLIIGDGPERAKLEGEIDRLGLADSVFLVGEVKGAAKLLRGFDVFTLTSRYEGLSMTLTEAMHAGVPLLVSDVGCSSSVVGDERMVFQAGDAIDFVTKIRELLELEDFEELTQKLQAQAKQLSLSASVERYLQLYEWVTRLDTLKEVD